MSESTPMPKLQEAAFRRWLALRLGLNEHEVTRDFQAVVEGDGGPMATVQVSFTAQLPEAEVLQAFERCSDEMPLTLEQWEPLEDWEPVE